MTFFREMLSEKSNVSSVRVMSLISCLSAVGIAVYGLNRPSIDYSGLSLLCGTFLGAGFGAKVWQKKIEKVNSIIPENDLKDCK
jgi:uncharacterized membrane protein YfcA